jgi:hypothetical protein
MCLIILVCYCFVQEPTTALFKTWSNPFLYASFFTAMTNLHTLWMYTHKHTHTCTLHLHTHTRTHTSTHTRTHAHTKSYAYTGILLCTVHLHTHTHTYTHTSRHAHTQNYAYTGILLPRPKCKTPAFGISCTGCDQQQLWVQQWRTHKHWLQVRALEVVVSVKRLC